MKTKIPVDIKLAIGTLVRFLEPHPRSGQTGKFMEITVFLYKKKARIEYADNKFCLADPSEIVVIENKDI